MLGRGVAILYFGPAVEPVMRWRPQWPPWPGSEPYWLVCGAANPGGDYWMTGRVWVPASGPWSAPW